MVQHMHSKQTYINFLLVFLVVPWVSSNPETFTAGSNKIISNVMSRLFPEFAFEIFILQAHTTNRSKFCRDYENIANLYLQIPKDFVRPIHTVFVSRAHDPNFVIQIKGKIDSRKSFKHSSGYIHVYFIPREAEFILMARAFQNITGKLRELREWPINSIFLTLPSLYSPTNLRIIFYKTILPHTFARGLILDILFNSSQVSLVCVQCPHVLTFLHRDRLKEQIRSYCHLTSQMHGDPVRTRLTEQGVNASQLQQFCNFMTIPKLSKYTTTSKCVYYFLSAHLNFSYYHQQLSPEGNLKDPTFITDVSCPVTISNWRILRHRSREMEWISHGSKVEKFHFVPFQKSSLDYTLLTKPYDRITWTLLLCGVTLLVVLTMLFKALGSLEPGKAPVTFMKTLISVSAAILYQAVSETFSKRVVLGSQILPVLWFLWIHMMIVISNGYTGSLYSLLTSGLLMHWPTSLKELLMDDSYCIFTGEDIKVWNGSHTTGSTAKIRNLLINPSIWGKFGSKRFMENLDMLNKSMKYYPQVGKIGLGAEREIVERNSDGMFFKVGTDICNKVAFISENRMEELFIQYFLNKVLTGHSVVIQGYLKLSLIAAERNFFHGRFLTAISYLDAGGFTYACRRNVMKWFVCFRIYEYQKHSLETKGNLQTWRSGMTRIANCMNQLNNLFFTNRFILQKGGEKASAFSMNHLVTFFKIYHIGLVISFLAFMIEMVKFENVCLKLVYVFMLRFTFQENKLCCVLPILRNCVWFALSRFLKILQDVK